MHYFKMPENHPGHECFEGCSGAPIIGEDGKVVSLVSGGCVETNEIFGNNLSKCIRTLDNFLESILHNKTFMLDSLKITAQLNIKEHIQFIGT